MIRHPIPSRFPQFTFEKITPWIQLFKIPLCLPIALSATFGYILHTPNITFDCILITIGLLFLACGAAGLNSLQEINTDNSLLRTKSRPLVTGVLKRERVTPIICIVLVCSLLILVTTGSQVLLLVLLGFFGIVLYNGIYTPLKSFTTFSLIPGACAGAIPPFIGWVCAGGSPGDYRILAVLLLFFIWQIPHFFMILLKHKDDYNQAKSVNAVSCFTEQSVKRISFIWLMCFICTSLSITAIPDFLTTSSRIIFAIIPSTCGLSIAVHLLRGDSPNYQFLFITLNCALFVSLILVACLQLL